MKIYFLYSHLYCKKKTQTLTGLQRIRRKTHYEVLLVAPKKQLHVLYNIIMVIDLNIYCLICLKLIKVFKDVIFEKKKNEINKKKPRCTELQRPIHNRNTHEDKEMIS